MILPVFVFLFIIAGIARSEGGEAASPLVQEFTKDIPMVLEPPFTGKLHGVWPKDAGKSVPEAVRLDVLKPADRGDGFSPIRTPYLATSKGESYWGAFALRPKLPDTKVLTSLKTYSAFVVLLGDPTHQPFSGETDDNWAYDTVSWRFFAPSKVDTIEILEISIARKQPIDGGEYIIHSFSVRRGTLSKSKNAGMEQPENRSMPKPE